MFSELENCFDIYFILDAVTQSAFFYFFASALLVIGQLCCCVGHFGRGKKLCTFLSGVLFIISGKPDTELSKYNYYSLRPENI